MFHKKDGVKGFKKTAKIREISSSKRLDIYCKKVYKNSTLHYIKK